MLRAAWKLEGAVPIASPALEPVEPLRVARGPKLHGQLGRKRGRTGWPLGCAVAFG